jgi:hypothetical protein
MRGLILTVSASTLLVASFAHAQDASSRTADELKAIIAKPHDDKPALQGFEIFPNVREWDVAGTFIDSAGKREPFKGKTTSKRVDGKYEVTQTLFEGHGVAMTLVVAWDPKTGIYYQYNVPPKGKPSKSIGMRVPNTRSIAWATVAGGPEMVTVETYDEKKMTWRSVMVNKAGGVTLTTEGEARPAQEPARSGFLDGGRRNSSR